jgi:hypothetical protein
MVSMNQTLYTPNGGSLTYVNANGSQTTINGTENNVQIQAVSVNTPHPGVLLKLAAL